MPTKDLKSAHQTHMLMLPNLSDSSMHFVVFHATLKEFHNRSAASSDSLGSTTCLVCHGCIACVWHCVRAAYSTSIFILIVKARLLAGVGFALAMNWGQTGRSCHDFSCRTCFGPPCSAWLIMPNCDPPLRAQTPLRPSRWVSSSSVTARLHAHARA